MQTFLQNTTPLPPGSARSHAINRSIGLFMAHDMRPYSVVENVGFRRMVRTLEPRYNIPSKTYFATNVVPKLYRLEEKLKEAKSVSLTTDEWTSRSANRFITVTVHFIESQWEIQNYVLQTRVFNESHTASNLSTILLKAVDEWSLFRERIGIPV
ncbi:hypothetical protein SNE40_009967 [Patella caerulea]|uniref:Uncharacterized protein n=1 Tax=Patella caerulea TaxID=87958 RepID=A0AAN8JZT1_PATCE